MWRTQITEAQAKEILSAGDIPQEMTNVSAKVAVVLTQSWCPQWKAMDAYLSRMAEEKKPETDDLVVFHLFYDLLPFSEDFMRFKETHYSNDKIPFVLYYRDGKLKETTNYVSESGFLSLF